MSNGVPNPYGRYGGVNALPEEMSHLKGRRVQYKRIQRDAVDVEEEQESALPTNHTELLQAMLLASRDRLNEAKQGKMLQGATLFIVLILLVMTGVVLKGGDDLLRELERTGVMPLLARGVQTYTNVWEPELNVTIAAATDMAVAAHNLLVIAAPELRESLQIVFNTMMHFNNTFTQNGGISVVLG